MLYLDLSPVLYKVSLLLLQWSLNKIYFNYLNYLLSSLGFILTILPNPNQVPTLQDPLSTRPPIL